jgi:hypothetical protein
MQKNFSENYPQFVYTPSVMFTSPILGQKIGKNIGWRGCQIISLPGVPTCLRLALLIHHTLVLHLCHVSLIISHFQSISLTHRSLIYIVLVNY